MQDDYLKHNQALWDTWANLHVKSEFYGVDHFRRGRSSLTPVELEEVGDVQGKSLLHLQCHFGMDSLSWARLGAHVTGVDFSATAITQAQSLAQELGIQADFVRSDIYDLPRFLEGKFDVVFTSYGVLGWLPDLKQWADVIAHFLRPGGLFYIVEFHPLAFMLDEENPQRLKYPYFFSAEPLATEEKGSYASPDPGLQFTSYCWIHSLSDIINSLIGAGLRIRSLREYPFSSYPCWPFLEERAPSRWEIRGGPATIPMMFSVQATH